MLTTNTPIGATSPLQPLHTPTPWVIGDSLNGTAVYANGEHITTMNNTQPNAPANARHIVHCVNNFDGLVEVLEKANDALTRFLCGRVAMPLSIQEDVKKMIVEALAKAKGGE